MNLGAYYEKNDLNLAIHYYQKAKDLGNDSGYFNLGKLLSKIDGN